MADLKTRIEDAANGPAQVQGDEGSVRQQPIQDLIAADRYLQGKTAMSKTSKGLRFVKMGAPGPL